MSTRSLFTSESFRALRVTSAHTQHSLHFSVLFVHFCVFKIYKKLLFTSYKKVVFCFFNEMNKTVGGLEDGDLQSSVSSEEAGWRGDPGDLLP